MLHLGVGWKWLVSFTLWSLYHSRNNPCTRWRGAWMGPREGPDPGNNIKSLESTKIRTSDRPTRTESVRSRKLFLRRLHIDISKECPASVSTNLLVRVYYTSPCTWIWKQFVSPIPILHPQVSVTPQSVRTVNLRPANLWVRVTDVMSFLLAGCRANRRCYPPHTLRRHICASDPCACVLETSWWKCAGVFCSSVPSAMWANWLVALNSDQGKVRTDRKQIECLSACVAFGISAFHTTVLHWNILVRVCRGELQRSSVNILPLIYKIQNINFWIIYPLRWDWNVPKRR